MRDFSEFTRSFQIQRLEGKLKHQIEALKQAEHEVYLTRIGIARLQGMLRHKKEAGK